MFFSLHLSPVFILNENTIDIYRSTMYLSIHSNLDCFASFFFFTFTSSSESGSRTPRRKSFYNFFLRHQDAVDDSIASPLVNRKAVSPNASVARTSLSAANSFDEKQQQQMTTPTTAKTKRATSFVRKKPPFERGLSAQSALRINKNAQVGK